MTPVEYQAWVADLVNYLDFMAEPDEEQADQLGIMVLIYLGVLFVLRLCAEARVLEGRSLEPSATHLAARGTGSARAPLLCSDANAPRPRIRVASATPQDPRDPPRTETPT